ncbi:VanW family protein [Flexivirga oryzae]|uniref:Vancomycin resistance protein YoaR n=1 Tax=Flexivirga oryzae TaxID=1794944 RepID=A0A839N9J9_9MICO|nr:VanW family protein [Flexivirga oryzae]MBB2894430.1 vancomycin resistance protein YoaR [Flexivirga oryzae]
MSTDASGGDRDSSGADDNHRRRSRLRKGLLIGVPAAVVVLAGGYVALAASQSGKIQRGTTVAGRHIGGMSVSDAKAEVSAAAAQQVKTPVQLVVGGTTLKLDPAKSGLSMSSAGVLDGLSGFSLNPSTVWHRLTGDGPHRTLTPKVDRDALQKAVAAASDELEGAPKNGTVKFVDGKVVTTKSTPGDGVDTKSISQKIAAGWPHSTKFAATLTHQPAALTDDEIQRYVKDFADPAMSAPVTVKVGGKTAELEVSDISDILSTTFDGAKLAPKVDQDALATLLDKQASKLTTPAVDAKLSYRGGKRTITPAKDGTGPDTKGAGKLLVAALTAPDRTMSLPTKPVEPTVTAADLKKTKIGSQMISEFVSVFPTGAENAARTHNISVGLAKLNGIVVQPGETFSLLNTLRPFDAAHGYVDAPVLVGGRDVPGMGGGISQVSTTLYNATFFAGVKLVEHTAHAYWIPRYPMGREATMWDPTIDNKWTNDTGHPIRIQAGIEGNASVIRLYGVKTFTVSSTTSNKFDIVAPGPAKHLSGPSCIAQGPEDGFSVTVTRVVKNLAGKVVKNESLTTRYQPADPVICN